MVCGVKGTLINMNSKDLNILSNMVNERLISSTYSLLNISLPSIGWLTIVVFGIGIIKVWTSHGMISPFSGLIGLVTNCTIYGIVGTLLLVPISTNTKLGVCTWNLRKQFSRHAAQVDNFVHKNKPTPYSPESTLMWTLKPLIPLGVYISQGFNMLLDGLNSESKGEQWKEKEFFLHNLILEKLLSIV